MTFKAIHFPVVIMPQLLMEGILPPVMTLSGNSGVDDVEARPAVGMQPVLQAGGRVSRRSAQQRPSQGERTVVTLASQ